MRKIDVVLLTALILYDYSAQSLVDRDVISLGKAFIADHTSLGNDRLAVPPVQVDDNNKVLTGAEMPTEDLKLAVSTAEQSNSISYYDLANINATTSVNTADASEDNNNSNFVISTPSPIDADAPSVPELDAFEAEESNSSLSLSQLSTSASVVSMSATASIEVKGELTENGMSFADSDKDEMYDFEDKCPSIPGVARFEGCPVPDSDADGVNDEEDRCPFEAGAAFGSGCPVENTINSGYQKMSVDNTAVESRSFLTLVQFENNSKVLSTDEFNQVLKLADIALNNSFSKIEISKTNDSGSDAQVNTIMQYLKDLGVKDSQIQIAENNRNNAVNSGVGIKLNY